MLYLADIFTTFVYGVLIKTSNDTYYIYGGVREM